MKKTINIGIIGSGWIVESFLAATKNVEGLKLTCVYSRTMERASEFAKKLDTTLGFKDLICFDSLDEMAKSDKLDGVYIASPNALHYPQSRLFLENKKHVICEKSITISGSFVNELLEIAKENNVIFMEAIMALHSPQMKLLSEEITKLGSISQASFSYCQLSSKYEALSRGELPNIFNPLMQTGCIMDIGVYCAYPAIALFSAPISVTSHAVLLPNGIDLCGSSIFKYSTKIVSLNYSKVGDGYSKSEIIGDKGTITIDKLSTLDGIELKYKENGSIKTRLIHKTPENVLPMQHEAQSFYNYITDFEEHKAQYEYLSRLAITVSDVMNEMRNQGGVCF